MVFSLKGPHALGKVRSVCLTGAHVFAVGAAGTVQYKQAEIPLPIEGKRLLRYVSMGKLSQCTAGFGLCCTGRLHATL